MINFGLIINSVGVRQPPVPCVTGWCEDCMCGVRAAPTVATSITSCSGWPTTRRVQPAVATCASTRSRGCT